MYQFSKGTKISNLIGFEFLNRKKSVRSCILSRLDKMGLVSEQ